MMGIIISAECVAQFDDFTRNEMGFPTGFNRNGLPTNITLVGKLYSEATLLAVAKAFQENTDFNKQHPDFFE
jgi:Asp-tRNA(Asn)/Glu-tRNA(Gln) amidotransferase A subunit family amidase